MPDTQGKRKLEGVQTVHRKKSKLHKTFLDSQEALSLATLIVDAQEQKSSKKAETIKARKDSVTRPPSKTRSRLEERKEALAAQVNRAKREKAKSRKGRLNDPCRVRTDGRDDNNPKDKGQVRKSVTFA